jgi:Flp pilus assembly protein TadG
MLAGTTSRIRAHSKFRRRGMTIVESTLVLSVFLLLLFGIFEYCRFLLVLHLTNNAARDGARYAAVRVNADASQIPIVQQEILDYTKARMSGVDKQINNCKIIVYALDQAGLDQTPPVIRGKPKTAGGPYPNPFPEPDSDDIPQVGIPTNGVAWNTVGFTERVAVSIKGEYKPLLPTFLLMPSSIKIKITAMMAGES